MHEMLLLALSGVAGGLLGAVFFGGLWWTVRKVGSSSQPALWVFSSLLLRMSVALTGFYVVSGSHWERMALCLLGFILARLIVTRLTRPLRANQTCAPQEVHYAP